MLEQPPARVALGSFQQLVQGKVLATALSQQHSAGEAAHGAPWAPRHLGDAVKCSSFHLGPPPQRELSRT